MHICLVRKCADTLISLDIAFCGAKELIYNTNGNSVIYSNMQYLSLKLSEVADTSMQVLAPDIVPFPSLISLTLESFYLYDDDVLFRGNSASLEQLYLLINRDTVLKLNMLGVFKNKVKALRNVYLSEEYDTEDLSRTFKAELDTFLCDLMCTVHKVVSGTVSTTKYLVGASQPQHDFKNVKSLDTSDSPLSLHDTMCLLMALPALTTLKCGTNGLGSGFAHVSMGELPDYIASLYNEAGRFLNAWKVTSFNSESQSLDVEYLITHKI
ncbi:hypothetical protein GGI08_000280 [Coemansia sp. S2]|nr:hypothetical protein GGI08_000280 [Coemansia sp. S2]